MPVFDTHVGIPLPVVNLAQRKGYQTRDFPGLTSIAEIATLQLEFRYLSHLTGNDDYWRAVTKVWIFFRMLSERLLMPSKNRSCKSSSGIVFLMDWLLSS